MRKNFGSKEWLYPQPVLIVAAYDEHGNPNAMNAAWGGTADYKQITICLSKGHKTVKNLLHTGAFTVSIGQANLVVECDYVGLVSGNKVADKFEQAGFHATKSEFVNAPLIDELGMAFECKVISYNPETGTLLGEVVNVSVSEDMLGEDGKPDVQKLQPITFDAVHNSYIKLGEKVGNAFKDGRKLIKK